MASKKHYSYSDRLAIETMLNESRSIKEIELDIKRDPSNIIREINKHASITFPSFYGGQNPCLKWKTCDVKEIECYKTCKNIEYKICPKLDRSPHVCNGCTTKHGCRHVKKYYKAREAHDSYKQTLSVSRVGLHYTPKESMILKEVLCPLIINSKSVYHAVTVVNNEYDTEFILKSIYRQIQMDYLPIKSSDLPRTRRRIKTTKKDTDYKRDIKGHTYEDYLEYKNNNPNAVEMQMDTVEGIKGVNEPVILTLEIPEISFLFIFKISSQTKDEVIKKLNFFKDIISDEIFDRIMEILLTDNGHEFLILDEVTSISSNINLFYCHPYSSYEKGEIENVHEFIRRVIPQGVSLKHYTQKELNLLCSNINSLYRESLDGKSPFDLIDKYVPIEIIEKLGLHKINPLNVCLVPELLGDKSVNNIKKHLSYEEIKRANIKFKKDEF